MPAGGIYVASKVKHHAKWLRWRDELGAPIISTWIDEAGPGQSDFTELWPRMVREASTCDVLVIYCEEGDVLKGAFVELGAALAANKRVHACGLRAFTFAHHPNLVHYDDVVDAMRDAANFCGVEIR